ncbi:MAG: hypothetical protein QNJ31_08305 [Candidatus Caenarcaniphilales bacterium]|nr:hypothetical protein [Candidatus Caenarcaniphilales bacterium]
MNAPNIKNNQNIATGFEERYTQQLVAFKAADDEIDKKLNGQTLDHEDTSAVDKFRQSHLGDEEGKIVAYNKTHKGIFKEASIATILKQLEIAVKTIYTNEKLGKQEKLIALYSLMRATDNYFGNNSSNASTNILGFVGVVAAGILNENGVLDYIPEIDSGKVRAATKDITWLKDGKWERNIIGTIDNISNVASFAGAGGALKNLAKASFQEVAKGGAKFTIKNAFQVTQSTLKHTTTKQKILAAGSALGTTATSKHEYLDDPGRVSTGDKTKQILDNKNSTDHWGSLIKGVGTGLGFLALGTTPIGWGVAAALAIGGGLAVGLSHYRKTEGIKQVSNITNFQILMKAVAGEVGDPRKIALVDRIHERKPLNEHKTTYVASNTSDSNNNQSENTPAKSSSNLESLRFAQAS